MSNAFLKHNFDIPPPLKKSELGGVKKYFNDERRILMLLMVFVLSELERLLMEDRECQDRYTVVKYNEEVCISKVLKEIVNKAETERKEMVKKEETKRN